MPPPAAPLNATTVSDWWYPVCAGAERTVAPVRVPVACAFQISETPGRVFARFTSVQVRPAPVTVPVCPVRWPSDETKASRRSPDFAVVNAGVVCAPLPSTLTLWSTASAPPPGGGGGGGGGEPLLSTVTATTDDVLVRPCASVVRADSQCEPSTTVLESQVSE